MTTYIALLRGVNVAGKKQVAMSALRDLLAGLDFDDPRSLLQSGNLVFRSSTQPSAELEHLLETETEKRLHVRAAFFIRSAKEWATAIDANPFPDEAKHDPSHLVLMTLKDAPEAKAVKALQAAITGPELIRAKGRQLYITYPNGIGRSRLTNRLIEDKLTARGTGRNWNTVLKVAALARG